MIMTKCSNDIYALGTYVDNFFCFVGWIDALRSWLADQSSIQGLICVTVGRAICFWPHSPTLVQKGRLCIDI